MPLQICIAISQKQWPVGASKVTCAQKKKRQTCRRPAQTGSPIALANASLDRPAGTKLVTGYCSAPSLPVFAQSSKNRVFRGNFFRYKFNKVPDFGEPSSAP